MRRQSELNLFTAWPYTGVELGPLAQTERKQGVYVYSNPPVPTGTKLGKRGRKGKSCVTSCPICSRTQVEEVWAASHTAITSDNDTITYRLDQSVKLNIQPC